MTLHVLKSVPSFFEELLTEKRNYEIRKDDRGFKVGDTVEFVEYEPEHDFYTGRKLRFRIKHLALFRFGLREGYTVLSLDKPGFLDRFRAR